MIILSSKSDLQCNVTYPNPKKKKIEKKKDLQFPTVLQKSEFVIVALFYQNSNHFRDNIMNGFFSLQGDYRVDAKITDTSTGEEVACYHVEVSAAQPPCSGFLCNIFG